VIVQSTSVTHTNTNRVVIQPASTSAEVGDIDVFRVRVYENADYVSASAAGVAATTATVVVV
jgi:hypothetical protein